MRPLSAYQDSTLALQKNSKETLQADTKRQQAWARAMEQEQMNSWLRFGLVSRSEFEQSDLDHVSSQRDDGTRETIIDDHLSVASVGGHLRENKLITQVTHIGEDSMNVIYERSITATSVMLAGTSTSISEITDNISSGSLLERNFEDSRPGSILKSELNIDTSKSDEFKRPTIDPEIADSSLENLDTVKNQIGEFGQHHDVGQRFKQFLVALFSQPELLSGNQIVEVEPQTSPHRNYLLRSVGAASVELETKDTDPPPDEIAESKGISQEQKIAMVERNNGIRVHTEWANEGVRIWLGVDQGLHLNIDMLANRIEMWLRDQRVKVIGLVCNGRELLDGEKGKVSLKPGSEEANVIVSQNSREEMPDSDDLRFVINFGKLV